MNSCPFFVPPTSLFHTSLNTYHVNYRFNQDSDSESENGDNVEDDLAQHNEVEEEQLNPYREAFESGYNRAEDEGDMKASERRRADEVDG